LDNASLETPPASQCYSAGVGPESFRSHAPRGKAEITPHSIRWRFRRAALYVPCLDSSLIKKAFHRPGFS